MSAKKLWQNWRRPSAMVPTLLGGATLAGTAAVPSITLATLGMMGVAVGAAVTMWHFARGEMRGEDESAEIVPEINDSRFGRFLAEADLREFARQAILIEVNQHQLTTLLTATLNRRLAPQELTYQRYRTAGTEALDAVMDQLHEAHQLMQRAQAVDLKHTAERLRYLEGRSDLAPEDREELQTMQARNDLRADLVRKVSARLTQAEQFSLGLNHLIEGIDGMGRGQSEADAGRAVNELQQLAEQAKKYK